MIKQLGKQIENPWVCIGDFNEILSVNEKEGRVDRSSRQMENFRQCLECTGLRDLGFTGSWYTWAGGRRDYGCIRARIGRAVATIEWCGKFPRARLFHLANLASDHCILHCILLGDMGNKVASGKG